jgi:hypothetical protein
MAKNLTGINLKGLSSAEMRKGKTFKQSHGIAMKKVGK